MKRILCITENLGSGGAERQLTGLAVQLKEAGYTVKFVTYVHKQFYESYLRSNGVDYELYERAANKYTRVFYISRLIRSFRPDVVISFLPAVNMTMCLTKLISPRFKLIVSERSHTNRLTPKVRLLFRLYALADYVVTNSYSEAENINSLAPYLRTKLTTITNYVDTNVFCPANGKNKTSSDEVSILSVGRIIPVKNILNYIRAIKQVLDWGYNVKAVWHGSNYDKLYYTQCTDLIDALGLNNNFEFRPQTSAIADEYRRADIFCLPSLYEGFPNVICEAMSSGLPVVCSRVCDNPRIVVETENGFLFDPNSVDQIATALRHGIECNWAEVGERNREKAIKTFSIDKFLSQYITLIMNE